MTSALMKQTTSNIYHEIKRWEAYLNHCWCARIRDIHDSLDASQQRLVENFQGCTEETLFKRDADNYNDDRLQSDPSQHLCSKKAMEMIRRQLDKFQLKLMFFERFPPMKYFRKTVIDYKKLLDGLKEKSAYILHMCDDWFQTDKDTFEKQLEFFQYLKDDCRAHLFKDAETNFIILDYDLNKHLLKNSDTPDRCCIHYIRQNRLISTDYYGEFGGDSDMILPYPMYATLYWNLSLNERELCRWYQNFIKK